MKIQNKKFKNTLKLIANDLISVSDTEDDYASDGALKSLLNKLRMKIGKDSIKNHSGLGYQIITK